MMTKSTTDHSISLRSMRRLLDYYWIATRSKVLPFHAKELHLSDDLCILQTHGRLIQWLTLQNHDKQCNVAPNNGVTMHCAQWQL